MGHFMYTESVLNFRGVAVRGYTLRPAVTSL
jgi:hypothetical protein